MKKTRSIIFIIVFIAICITPLIGSIFGYKSQSTEKRELSSLPGFIVDGNINAEFTQQLDDYFTDNFAFRPELVTAYAYTQSAVFGESVSDKVIVGKDGWLFFVPTLDDYRGTDGMSDNEIYRTYKTLEIQQKYLSGKGIDFIFAVAPNKSSLYGEYMPNKYRIVNDQSNADKLFAMLDSRGVDYVNLHTALVSEEQLYFKIDTHWNNKGAMIAYNSLLSKVQDKRDDFAYNAYQDVTPTLTISHSGDLSGMLFPVSDILDEQYDYGLEKEYSTARPVKSLDDITITAQCESGTLNLLMFRDSFANALIPIMANEFSSVTFSRATPYNYNLLDNTDVVIEEIVERNLPDIILKAPIMPAYTIEIDEALTQTQMDISISIEEGKDYWKLVGIAKPEDYNQDSNYDIYIRIGGSDSRAIFVPFPILDNGYFEDSSGSSNAAFSMIIEKNMMGEQSEIDIIVFYNGEYFVDTVTKDDKTLPQAE